MKSVLQRNQTNESVLGDTGAAASASKGNVRAVRRGAYAFFLLLCWTLIHHYQGLGYDAQLYAFQALARIHPGLSHDLFLRDALQDRISLFTPLYAQVIRWLDLERATLALMVAAAAGFYIAAFAFARRLCGERLAWMSTAVLAIIIGHFGAFSVISYQEDFLSARSAAEALTIAALALQAYDRRALAIFVIALACLMHPIMALPGLLLLACQRLPLRLCAAFAIAGVAVGLAIAVAAATSPGVARIFPLLDADWLYVVRERSQYLLLNIWTLDDWLLNARPFAALALTSLAVTDTRIRQLALAAMLIGASGLALAAIGSICGPVAILVQAQPWRFMWLTTFVAVMLLPITLRAVLREPRNGALCAVLMLLAWTYPLVNSMACASLALAFWLVRERLDQRALQWLRVIALGLLTIMALWMAGNIWTMIRAPFDTGSDPPWVQFIKNLAGLQTPMVALAVLIWWLIGRLRTTVTLMTIGVASAILLALTAPGAFRKSAPLSAVYRPGDFADWQRILPEGSNVLAAVETPSISLIWFVLQRPNYLSEAQSAGVVFSRSTAIEVKRRSDRIETLIDPNWKIYSSRAAYASDRKHWKPPGVRALTVRLITQVCADPELGFLIARENVGFGAHTHLGKGPWHGWNLYDCIRVRNRNSNASSG